MSDALDRLVPEDQGKGGRSLYRHSAEGRDDMPVGLILFSSSAAATPTAAFASSASAFSLFLLFLFLLLLLFLHLDLGVWR